MLWGEARGVGRKYIQVKSKASNRGMVLSISHRGTFLWSTCNAPCTLSNAGIPGLNEVDVISAFRDLTGYKFICLLLAQETSGHKGQEDSIIYFDRMNGFFSHPARLENSDN